MFNLAAGKYLFQGKDALELIDKNKICDLSTIQQDLVGISK